MKSLEGQRYTFFVISNIEPPNFRKVRPPEIGKYSLALLAPPGRFFTCGMTAHTRWALILYGVPTTTFCARDIKFVPSLGLCIPRLGLHIPRLGLFIPSLGINFVQA